MSACGGRSWPWSTIHLQGSDRMPIAIRTGSPEATRAFGERLALLLNEGDVLLLHGDLGAGKTTLTQGILRGLRVTSPGQSPTFTLVSEHQGMLPGGNPAAVRHLDLYRLSEPEELDSFGYADLLNANEGVTLVEWPERAGDLLPRQYVLIEIDFDGDDQRVISVSAMPDNDRFRELADALPAVRNDG
jgi:tRNA threonylcarbamoyladenosine biosynthesis protein TsaE